MTIIGPHLPIFIQSIFRVMSSDCGPEAARSPNSHHTPAKCQGFSIKWRWTRYQNKQSQVCEALHASRPQLWHRWWLPEWQKGPRHLSLIRLFVWPCAWVICQPFSPCASRAQIWYGRDLQRLQIAGAAVAQRQRRCATAAPAICPSWISANPENLGGLRLSLLLQVCPVPSRGQLLLKI